LASKSIAQKTNLQLRSPACRSSGLGEIGELSANAEVAAGSDLKSSIPLESDAESWLKVSTGAVDEFSRVPDSFCPSRAAFGPSVI